MELDFDQPPDCTLESATIQLDLDEDDQGLGPYRVDNLPPSECPILITDYYGPGQIVGTSKTVLVRKALKIEQSVNVVGNGGSLGGITTEKAFQHESRWTFRSHRVPEDRASGKRWGHRILRWEMTENDIERSTHSNKVYTAFAYEHSGQTFLMKIEISGKLRKRSDRLKANLGRKFGPRARKQEDISTTLVGVYLGHRRPLDELVRGLASDMEIKNYMSSPLMVHDAQPASFQQVENDATSLTNAALESAPGGTLDQAKIEGATQPDLRLNGEVLDMLEDAPVRVLADRTQPTLENLARVGEYFRTLIRHEVIRGDISEASGHSSATTLVATQSEMSQPQHQPEAAPVPKSRNLTAVIPKKVDEDAMERVLEVGFLRLLIQFVIGFVDLFGSSKPRATQQRNEQKERNDRSMYREKKHESTEGQDKRDS